jgi:hypothetical protein
MQAFHELYAARHGRVTPGDLLRGEIIRYSDFLGIGSQRLHFLPFPVPLRLHVFVLIAAALAILAWKRRSLFWALVILIVPSLLIWPQTANPTVRYFATVTPYFGIAVGAALVSLKEASWHRIFAIACGLVVFTEFAGNLLVLRQARTANYPQVTRELRAIVPPDARVYGAITFFLSLYDRPYYSWNRTPLEFAVQKLGVNYLVLNDRVLLHGSGYGLDDWAEVRDAAARFVRSRADLVGKVPDAFYGDLEIYRVRP